MRINLPRSKFILALVVIMFSTGCAFIGNSIRANAIIYVNQTDKSTNDLQRVLHHSVYLLEVRSNAFFGWQLIFTDTYPEVVNLGDGRVAITEGITDYNRQTVTVKVNECVWDSALLHELAHIIQIQTLNEVDYNHANKSFWSRVKSLEEQMFDRCPADYKSSIRLNRVAQ